MYIEYDRHLPDPTARPFPSPKQRLPVMGRPVTFDTDVGKVYLGHEGQLWVWNEGQAVVASSQHAPEWIVANIQDPPEKLRALEEQHIRRRVAEEETLWYISRTTRP